jgi:carbon storage regulator
VCVDELLVAKLHRHGGAVAQDVAVAELPAMLVLSRKKNESIVVDQSIVITVVEIRGDKVRLGIEAPREVPIHRSEVHAAIQQSQMVDIDIKPE